MSIVGETDVDNDKSAIMVLEPAAVARMVHSRPLALSMNDRYERPLMYLMIQYFCTFYLAPLLLNP